MKVDLTKLKSEMLLDILDTHDCHMSEDDGCNCVFVKQELDRRWYAGDLPNSVYKPAKEQSVII